MYWYLETPGAISGAHVVSHTITVPKKYSSSSLPSRMHTFYHHVIIMLIFVYVIYRDSA